MTGTYEKTGIYTKAALVYTWFSSIPMSTWLIFRRQTLKTDCSFRYKIVDYSFDSIREHAVAPYFYSRSPNLCNCDAELCRTRAARTRRSLLTEPRHAAGSRHASSHPKHPSRRQNVRAKIRNVSISGCIHFLLFLKILPWCRHSWDAIPALTPDGWKAVRADWGRINPAGCEGRHSDSTTRTWDKKPQSYSCRWNNASGSLLELGIVWISFDRTDRNGCRRSSEQLCRSLRPPHKNAARISILVSPQQHPHPPLSSPPLAYKHMRASSILHDWWHELLWI